MSPDVKEFFSTYNPEVRVQDRDRRDLIISELLENPVISDEWRTYCRDLYAQAHFFKKSGRYRLFAPGNLGKGDFNVFRMFVESALRVTREGGWASQVVPEGLYNGANSMAIRQELYNAFDLKRVLGFENSREVWFAGIDSRMKFCIYNARKGDRTRAFRVAFNIRSPEQLSHVETDGCLSLPVGLVKEFSPEALAIMELGSQRDIDITVKMYERWPKFGDEMAGPPYRFYMREIRTGTHQDLFDEDPAGVPVYEGRMVDLYDHRAKGYRSGRSRAAVWEELPFGKVGKSIQPQWHVPPSRVPRLAIERITRYRIGFCDVASPTNERTLVGTLIPPNAICAHTVSSITFHAKPVDRYSVDDEFEWAYCIWLAIANSFSMDFLARKKFTLHASYTFLDSLPFPRLPADSPLVAKLIPPVLRLLCTGPEMASYWNAMAAFATVDPVPDNSTPPGLVDPEERLDARAQIDAIVAREVYGLSRDELDYILETFPIVREADVTRYGDYRTKILILEYFDAMTPSPTDAPAASS